MSGLRDAAVAIGGTTLAMIVLTGQADADGLKHVLAPMPIAIEAGDKPADFITNAITAEPNLHLQRPKPQKLLLIEP